MQGKPYQAAVRAHAVSTPQDPLQGPRQAATSPLPPSHRLQPFIGSQESRPLRRRGSTVLSTKSRDQSVKPARQTGSTSEPAGRPDGNFTLMVYTHANYTLIFIKIFQTVEEEGYSLVYSIKLELHLPIKTLQEKKVKPQMPYKYARKNLLRY